MPSGHLYTVKVEMPLWSYAAHAGVRGWGAVAQAHAGAVVRPTLADIPGLISAPRCGVDERPRRLSTGGVP